jgi:hypothetical protein
MVGSAHPTRPNQPDFQIEFVVDTGFNDYLTLPPQAINAMNLPQYSNTSVRLADGTETTLSIHSAYCFRSIGDIPPPIEPLRNVANSFNNFSCS